MATVNPTMAVTAPLLSFLSWNVNGLAAALKKKDLAKKMDEVDVVFLQETHIGENNEKLIQRFTGWHLHYTTYDTRSRGVAILVKKKVKFSRKEVYEQTVRYVNEKEVVGGGYLVLTCEIEDQLYTLVSVYNQIQTTDTSDAKPKISILSELSSVLQNNASGVLVIGGDFNTVFNPYIDKMSPKPNPSHLKLLPDLKKFIRSLQLVDVWRRKVKNHFFMSFHCKKNASRIDYFFLPEECLWRVEKCEFEDIFSDDHLPISLQLNTEVIRMDPNLDSEDQHRPDSEASVSAYMGNLSFSQPWIKDEDITEAIKSLQMSDTPRPNGRPVALYKSNDYIVGNLQNRYSEISDGSFDCQSHQFNKSIPKQTFHYFDMADSKDSPEESATREHSDSSSLDICPMHKAMVCTFSGSESECKSWDVCPIQTFHFFNVDYVILATILAKHLESQLEQKWPKPPNFRIHNIMFYHFVQYETVAVDLDLIEKSLQNVLKDDAGKYLKALKNILKNDSCRKPEMQWKLLCHGCPLTPVLRSFLLKYYAEEDLKSSRQEMSEDVKAYVHGDYVITIVPKNFKGGRSKGNYHYRVICSFGTFLRHYDGNKKRRLLPSCLGGTENES